METSYYKENYNLTVCVSGKLDTINAPEFGKILQNLLEEKPKSCLLDFTDLHFLSSSGLQVLLAGAKISKKEHINFAVFGMNEMINDVFCMSGFDRFIQSYASKEEALKNFNGSDSN